MNRTPAEVSLSGRPTAMSPTRSATWCAPTSAGLALSGKALSGRACSTGATPGTCRRRSRAARTGAGANPSMATSRSSISPRASRYREKRLNMPQQIAVEGKRPIHDAVGDGPARVVDAADHVLRGTIYYRSVCPSGLTRSWRGSTSRSSLLMTRACPTRPLPLEFVLHHLREIEGAEAFKEFMASVSRAFPDFRFDVHHMVAEDNLVSAHYDFSGTQHDIFLEEAPLRSGGASRPGE